MAQWHAQCEALSALLCTCYLQCTCYLVRLLPSGNGWLLGNVALVHGMPGGCLQPGDAHMAASHHPSSQQYWGTRRCQCGVPAVWHQSASMLHLRTNPLTPPPTPLHAHRPPPRPPTPTTPPQVLIRWALQRGTSALPKSTRPERIRSNLDVFDWRLDQPDFDQLSQLATQLRMVDGALWLHPQGPYRSLAELWDDPDEDGREARYVESLYERGLQLPVVELGPGGCAWLWSWPETAAWLA